MDKKLIDKAIDFAKRKHENQKDDTGKSYFTAHVMQVWNIMQSVTSDVNLLCAALLHDTVEDTGTTYQELVQEFNKDIADLVIEVTKEGQKDEYGYYFPRLLSRRGILLKFADRLSNLSRMESWSKERQDEYIEKSRFWKTGEGRNIKDEISVGPVKTEIGDIARIRKLTSGGETIDVWDGERWESSYKYGTTFYDVMTGLTLTPEMAKQRNISFKVFE